MSHSEMYTVQDDSGFAIFDFHYNSSNYNGLRIESYLIKYVIIV